MHEIWYAIAVFMLTAYVVLDGFDFGAGALHLFVARNDAERRQVLAAIGPFWDGNEVWLLAAGGALFVGFPRVLASGISGFYFAIFLVLWCLILRGVAIEFRSHVQDPLWRTSWDFFFWLASTLLPVFFGAALGNLVARRAPRHADGWFALALFTDFSAREPVGILDWYTVLVGVFALAALAAHGALFLTWKTDGPVQERSRAAAVRLYAAVAVLWPVVTLATQRVDAGFLSALASRPLAWLLAAVALGGLVAVFVGRARGRDLAAFLGSARFPGRTLGGDRRLRLPDHAAGDRGRGPLPHRLQRGGRSAGAAHGPLLVRGRLSACDPLLRHRLPPAPWQGGSGGGRGRLLEAIRGRGVSPVDFRPECAYPSHRKSLRQRKGCVLDPESPGVDRLREVLVSRGFFQEDPDGVLGAAFASGGHLRSDLPLYRRRLASPTPVHTLVKLFGLYVDVSEDDACAAFAPLGLDEVVAMGLVERRDGLVRSRVGLVTTGDLVLARDRLLPEGASLRPDHVIGLNPPAMQLAAITVRRPVRAALDLGCGGGVQALLAARHADRVVAVDVNPRALEFTRFNARVNGITNVECRQGDFFAPVKGERFDLVVCNPPYAISPDARFVFRDSGRPGDAVCEEVVSGIPDHLEEGGFASVLCNWALRRDEPWSAPPRRWVDGRGCDAWLLGSDSKDPLSYAAGWNRNSDRADYEASIDRWLAYYRERGIEAIGMGAVILRRRAGGTNWTRADHLAADPEGRCSEQVLRVFVAEDLNADLSDDAFLDRAFVGGSDHRLYQTLVRRDGEYRLEAAELRLTGGFGFRGVADGSTLELLRRCNGQRPLRAALSELAELAGTDVKTLTTAAVPAVRRLVALGFLLPANLRAERRTNDGGNGEVTTEEDSPAEGVHPAGERVGAGGP